jgi:hypothetical protein
MNVIGMLRRPHGYWSTVFPSDLNTEVNVLILRKHVGDKNAKRLATKLNHSCPTKTRNVEHVIYIRGAYVIQLEAIGHWKLTEIWDRVEEMFSSSAKDSRINLHDWGMIARVVLAELIENVRIKNDTNRPRTIYSGFPSPSQS